MTTGNESPGTGVTNDMLDGLLGAQVAAAQRRIAAERAREEWPVVVGQVLGKLTRRSRRHDDALAAIDARLAALESAMGIGRG